MMTWEEIKAKYPHEFVALDNVVNGPHNEILEANVIYSTRSMSYNALIEKAENKNLLAIYTGELENPDDLFVFPGPLPEFNVRAAFEKQKELGRALTKEEFDQLPRAVYTRLED